MGEPSRKLAFNPCFPVVTTTAALHDVCGTCVDTSDAGFVHEPQVHAPLSVFVAVGDPIFGCPLIITLMV